MKTALSEKILGNGFWKGVRNERKNEKISFSISSYFTCTKQKLCPAEEFKISISLKAEPVG